MPNMGDGHLHPTTTLANTRRCGGEDRRRGLEGRVGRDATVLVIAVGLVVGLVVGPLVADARLPARHEPLSGCGE